MARYGDVASPSPRPLAGPCGRPDKVSVGIGTKTAAVALLGMMVLGVVSLAAISAGSGSPGAPGTLPARFSPDGMGLANLTVTPGSGYVDTIVNATGSGYDPVTTLNVTFNFTVIPTCESGSLVSNSTGNFSCAFSVPEVPAGSYSVNASDGVHNGSFTFLVIAPTLSLAPSSGFVSSLLTATGNGYDVNTKLALTFGGVLVGCAAGSRTTNSTGFLNCTFPARVVPAGPYPVVATDRNNSGSGTFTVLSPTLSLTPNNGNVGSSVAATGSGYTRHTLLTVSFGSTPIVNSDCTSGSLTTDATGHLACTFAVPVVTAQGYTVVASDGVNAGAQSYTVGSPTLAAAPTHGNVGSSVTASGTGYSPGITLTLEFSATAITTCTSGSLIAGPSGGFSCGFSVAASVAGSHTITATDGTNAASTSFTVDPHITLSSSSGSVGTPVTVTGTGFDASASYSVTWGASTVCSGSSTDGVGDLSCVFLVPDSTEGVHSVTATEGVNSANSPFTVNPSVTIAPGSGIVGSAVTIAGSGFSASAAASVIWNGTVTLCSGTTNASGGIVCSSHVPPSPLGVSTVGIVEGAFSPSTSFTVLSNFFISTGQGIVGTVVTLIGSGLAANTLYRYCLQNTQTACPNTNTFTTDPHGTIPSATMLTIPNVAPGDYYVDVSLGAAFAASAPFVVTSASLQVSPTTGPAETVVSLTGSGFVAGDVYAFCFQPTGVACPSGTPTSFTSTGVGAIPAGSNLIVPPSPAGDYFVDVSQAVALITLAPFVVVPQIVLSPVSGDVGTLVQVNGTGMLPSAPYLVFWDSAAQVCSDSTTGNGSFSCAFVVPATPAGLAAVNASDGTNSPSANFTVVSDLVASPAIGVVGTAVSWTATGFVPLTSIVVKWNSTATLCSGSTDLYGGFACTRGIPTTPDGVYVVTATAGTSSASTSVTVLPALSLSVISGDVGTSVSASGTGFDASAAYTLMWNSSISLCSTTTLADGAFGCSFNVPAAPGGVHPLSAVEGSNHATAAFTVLASLLVTATIGFVGASETVTGTGFDASSPYNLTWDSASTLCTGTTDPNGSFGCTFVVPSSPAGSHRIVAVEGVHAPFVLYTVTSSLSLSPTTGPVGTPVTASGSGFGASSFFVVRWNGGSPLCSGATSGLGSFSCTFVLPREPAGTATVSGVQGSNQAGTAFTVTPDVVLSSAGGSVGSLVNMTGTGFTGSAMYDVDWNVSTKVCQGTTDATGSFVCTYTVPTSPAGEHTVTAVQGSLSNGAAYSVVPGLTLSSPNGSVGSVVTLDGAGFDASSGYVVLWNATTSLCSGTTNTNGGFTCNFQVPSALSGGNSITISEGAHSPAVLFTVLATPAPPPGGGGPFPWWEVVVVVALVIGVLLVLGLVYEYRRHGSGSRSPPRPYAAPGGQARTEGPRSPFDARAEPVSSPAAGGIAAGGTYALGTPDGEPEDIDALIARLERMSVQMFKKTPKQLADTRSVGEIAEGTVEE